MTDWTGGVASWIASGVALAGALISHGMSRQKVNDLAHRADKQDERMDGMARTIDSLAAVGNQVALLRQGTEAAHTLLLSQQAAAQAMSAERFEGLRGEVRAFMQGGAAARRTARTGG